jgi:hypothetical protein
VRSTTPAISGPGEHRPARISAPGITRAPSPTDRQTTSRNAVAQWSRVVANAMTLCPSNARDTADNLRFHAVNWESAADPVLAPIGASWERERAMIRPRGCGVGARVGYSQLISMRVIATDGVMTRGWRRRDTHRQPPARARGTSRVLSLKGIRKRPRVHVLLTTHHLALAHVPKRMLPARRNSAQSSSPCLGTAAD